MLTVISPAKKLDERPRVLAEGAVKVDKKVANNR